MNFTREQLSIIALPMPVQNQALKIGRKGNTCSDNNVFLRFDSVIRKNLTSFTKTDLC